MGSKRQLCFGSTTLRGDRQLTAGQSNIAGRVVRRWTCGQTGSNNEGCSLRSIAHETSEPLAVALHAVQRAGDLQGKRVVVNGAGPIGCLIIVSALAAGASEICVGDITDRALTIATKLGAQFVPALPRTPVGKIAKNKLDNTAVAEAVAALTNQNEHH